MSFGARLFRNGLYDGGNPSLAHNVIEKGEVNIDQNLDMLLCRF
ncbi:MAG: hypothetical protein R2827_15105 [Bdellovibrionales bacterium]